MAVTQRVVMAPAGLGPSDARTLARNAAALFAGQVVGLVVPLATIPYLARVLHPEGWAPVLVAQALGSWLIVMLEYGFDLSGTRAVARARHEPGSVPDVVRGVQSAKLMLVPVAALALVAAFFAVPSLRAHREMLAWTLAFAILRGLNPFWFYQGIERLQGAVAVESVTKALAALGVFVVVKDPADGWRVLALQAVFAAVSLGILTRWMANVAPLRTPSLKAGVAALRRSWVIFAFRASSGLYIQANALVLSVLGSPMTIATFGGGERVIRAAINLLQPLTQALFPRVSFLSAADPATARRFIMRCLLWIGLFGGVMGLVALAGAPLLVRVFLGPDYEPAIPVIRALAALPPLVAVNTVFGLYWAVPFGHEQAFFKTVIGAALVDIVLAFVLVPRWGALGMCGAVVGAEVFVTFAVVTLYLRATPR
jgi:PST family polysaccharide transporter